MSPTLRATGMSANAHRKRRARASLVWIVTLFMITSWMQDARADKKTVCTVTVNSADEKEAFRRSLPPDKFDFVELVEQGRSDWLASACRKGVRCDVLLISGHHDGETGFFSDRVEADEFLSPDQMERASCSDSCPGVFAQLKEVYLFGCNTLNPDPVRSASPEIVRSLVRSGHPRADAERLGRALSERHGDSTRERMRLIFPNVPAIYGFSAVAPLGPTSASFLNRYFKSASTGEVASGRSNAKLLGSFAGHHMVVAKGLQESDPQAAYRRDVCQFSDDRLSDAQKLRFIHALLGREMAEVRMFLDRIEKYSAPLRETGRQSPQVAQALGEITEDHVARSRYLEFTRDADAPGVRARMIEVAHRLGWLSPEQKRAELVQMINDQLARNAISAAEVDLVCGLNPRHEMDQDLLRLKVPPAQAERASNAAILACLGSVPAHARVLQALTNGTEEDVQIAVAYLHQRPLSNIADLRTIAAGIAGMNAGATQILALDALARHHLVDPEILEALTQLFTRTDSAGVQRAIAGILVRSDFEAIATAELVQTLRQHRIKSSSGEDVLDVLIRRLEAPRSLARFDPPRRP